MDDKHRRPDADDHKLNDERYHCLPPHMRSRDLWFGMLPRILQEARQHRRGWRARVGARIGHLGSALCHIAVTDLVSIELWAKATARSSSRRIVAGTMAVQDVDDRPVSLVKTTLAGILDAGSRDNFASSAYLCVARILATILIRE